MKDQTLDLLLKRMDDQKEESNRRFDELSKHMVDLRADVSELKEWRWTTKGKIAGISFISSGIVFLAVEWMKSVFK